MPPKKVKPETVKIVEWSIYVLRCEDGSLYTGITTDVQRRFLEHQAQNNKSSKYCRSNYPLQIVYSQVIGTKSEALKKECYIKSLTKLKKEEFIEQKI